MSVDKDNVVKIANLSKISFKDDEIEKFQEDLNQIILIEISDLEKRVKQLGYTIKLSEKAVDFLIDKGFDKQYGARPLKRSIQKYIEDKMASKILRKEISSGSSLKFNWDGKSDNLDIIIQKKQTTNS